MEVFKPSLVVRATYDVRSAKTQQLVWLRASMLSMSIPSNSETVSSWVQDQKTGGSTRYSVGYTANAPHTTMTPTSFKQS